MKRSDYQKGMTVQRNNNHMGGRVGGPKIGVTLSEEHELIPCDRGRSWYCWVLWNTSGKPEKVHLVRLVPVVDEVVAS